MSRLRKEEVLAIRMEVLRKKIRVLSRKERRLEEMHNKIGVGERSFSHCPVYVSMTTRKRLNALKVELDYASINDLISCELLDKQNGGKKK